VTPCCCIQPSRVGAGALMTASGAAEGAASAAWADRPAPPLAQDGHKVTHRRSLNYP
jgi:hypothetical protein